jgi:hypothetical protein
MFHAHKTEFAEKGWMGTFLVTEHNNPVNASRLSNITGVMTNLTNGGLS